MLLVFQYLEDAIQPELSSPARFRFKGGRVTWALRMYEGQTEILVSNIGLLTNVQKHSKLDGVYNIWCDIPDLIVGEI